MIHRHVYGKTERRAGGALLKLHGCIIKDCPNRTLKAYDLLVGNIQVFQGRAK